MTLIVNPSENFTLKGDVFVGINEQFCPERFLEEENNPIFIMFSDGEKIGRKNSDVLMSESNLIVINLK